MHLKFHHKFTHLDVLSLCRLGCYIFSWTHCHNQPGISTEHGELLAFWAAFLLVHLGGPSTITALNLEDNSLWFRHLFSLILQVATICYIFVRVRILSSSKLVVPTILIFISGIIKYSERTAALYLASIGKLKDSMLKDSLKLRNKETKKSYNFKEGDLRDGSVIVKHAHHLYEVSKGVIVDLIISFDEQGKIREFFSNINPQEALRLISVELNFFYEVLYTKASVSYSSLGLLFRCLSLGTVTAALVLFLQLNKDDIYSKFDVKLSYALLFGAVALDGIGLIMIFFSNWPVPKIASFGKPSSAGSSTKSYLTIQKPTKWVPYPAKYENIEHSLARTGVFCRRWSESISQYSLISYALGVPSRAIYILPGTMFALCCGFVVCGPVCLVFVSVIWLLEKFGDAARDILGRRFPIIDWTGTLITKVPILMNFVLDKLGLQDELGRFKYVYKEPISKELWEFIFKEPKIKSTLAQNPEIAKKMVGANKGDFVLQQDDDFKEDWKEMLHIIEGLDFDEAVILWHIATELLYHSELESEDGRQPGEHEQIFGKILSDYMLYLLVMKPTMMSTVAGAGQIRYRDARTDTCHAAKQYLQSHRRTEVPDEVTTLCRGVPFIAPLMESLHGARCQKLLDNEGNDEPSPPNVHKSKSVWSNACRLAKVLLQHIDDRKKRWRMIAKVWVEVLSYAASHCKGEAHAQALGNGGELITIVWLPMFHLGLSQHEIIEIVVADKDKI